MTTMKSFSIPLVLLLTCGTCVVADQITDEQASGLDPFSTTEIRLGFRDVPIGNQFTRATFAGSVVSSLATLGINDTLVIAVYKSHFNDANRAVVVDLSVSAVERELILSTVNSDEFSIECFGAQLSASLVNVSTFYFDIDLQSVTVYNFMMRIREALSNEGLDTANLFNVTLSAGSIVADIEFIATDEANAVMNNVAENGLAISYHGDIINGSTIMPTTTTTTTTHPFHSGHFPKITDADFSKMYIAVAISVTILVTTFVIYTASKFKRCVSRGYNLLRAETVMNQSQNFNEPLIEQPVLESDNYEELYDLSAPVKGIGYGSTIGIDKGFEVVSTATIEDEPSLPEAKCTLTYDSFADMGIPPS